MENGSATRRPAAARRVDGPRRRGLSMNVVVPVLLVAVVYGVLLRPSVTSPIVAAGAIVVVGLLAVVAAIGTECTSSALLVLAFGFAPLSGLSVGSGYISVATLIFALAFALVLPQLLHRPLRLPTMYVVGSALLVVMGLVSIPVAVSPLESANYVAVVATALVGIPTAMVWMRPSQRVLFAAAVAFGAGTAISTLVGLPRNEYRNSGVTYHPVALAYTAMLTLSLVPYLISSGRRGRWIVVPPVAFVALVAVWTSGSRTSIVVLAALVVLAPMFERSIRLGLAVVAGALVVLPTVFALGPTEDSTSALSRLFGQGGAQGSDTVRIETLKDGLARIREHPIIGNGFSVETHTIHNLYLQILEAEGVLGLVGLLLMATALILPLRTAPSPERWLAYPALAFVLAGPFQPNMGAHFLALTLGMSLIAAVGVKERQEGRFRGRSDHLAVPTGGSGTPLGADRRVR